MDYYDKTSPASIELYAQQLIGKSFREIIDNDKRTENKNRKGNLGEIIEECFFHYKCNSDSQADFAEAGVELKVTCYKKNKDGSISAKERLVLNMIDYMSVVNETDFENSHMWLKSKLILLIYYYYNKLEQIPNIDRKIHFAKLFTPPEQDLIIIKKDYNFIINKIKQGLAHELSEGDTMYLGSCTKSSDSSIRRKQPFSDIPAKPRAFCFKNSYMTFVLNTYIAHTSVTTESIIQNEPVFDFEAYVINKIEKYAGYTVQQLCKLFDIEYNARTKSMEALLTYRILGIKGNQAEEFEKANIVIKAIRIEKTGKIRQNMSFPNFKFKEIIKEDWETSTFCTYLDETKFLFVIFKYNDNNELVLKGCQFWHIPYNDLQVEVRSVWEKTVEVLKNGLEVTHINGKDYNNFPKASENRVSHVRPHAQNKEDTYELPDGRMFPKQCFWLNNTYILSQLEDRFK